MIDITFEDFEQLKLTMEAVQFTLSDGSVEDYDPAKTLKFNAETKEFELSNGYCTYTHHVNDVFMITRYTRTYVVDCFAACEDCSKEVCGSWVDSNHKVIWKNI